MARIEALGSGTKHSSSSLCCKTTCTSHDFQTMREEIRERLGVRMSHAHVEKRGNDSHEQEHPVWRRHPTDATL